jgi:glutamate/tyrosine decarboxylase-like PLP-dependent enzyme
MSIKTFGFDKYARIIEQNVAQAAYLASLVEKSDHLELVAPVPLNVVCFRYVSPAVDEAELNALNEQILVRLQEEGLAVPSGVHIRDRFAIRVANVNHRSTMSDFDELVRDVVRLGGEVGGVSRRPH